MEVAFLSTRVHYLPGRQVVDMCSHTWNGGSLGRHDHEENGHDEEEQRGEDLGRVHLGDFCCVVGVRMR